MATPDLKKTKTMIANETENENENVLGSGGDPSPGLTGLGLKKMPSQSPVVKLRDTVVSTPLACFAHRIFDASMFDTQWSGVSLLQSLFRTNL